MDNILPPPIDSLEPGGIVPPPYEPTYTLSTVPSAARPGTDLVSTVITTNVSTGTEVYWGMSGDGVTSSFFTSGTLTGTATINNGSATFTQTVADPALVGTYTVNVDLYSDPGRTTKLIDESQVVSITFADVPQVDLQLGAYIDLWQYRNTDATYPYINNTGLNPVVRASNIKDACIPQLDKFYLFAEVQINGDNGKLYFGAADVNGWLEAAQVLNPAGTDWNTNTGSPEGTYVNPINPDYANSAWALKNTVAYMVSQNVPASNRVLSIGGYLLSNNMDLAGSTPEKAAEAAAQIVTLMNICGAVGVDIDYEPVGAPCNPARMAVLMEAIYTAVKQNDPAHEVHLTLIPSLTQADPDQRIATAVACQAHVDQINVMTYDDPSDLGQPPYQPGDLPVFNHTGVDRSVQSVQWFIDAGVERTLLGMGIALYARNANGVDAFGPNNPVVYSQIVTAADRNGESTNSFPLGRYLGYAKIQNPNPGSQDTYYYPSVEALWAFDSVDTVADKVASAKNMGLRAVFAWQISNDYAITYNAPPAGDARANFALISAARNSIDNL